jgi:hypothetical protein
MEKTGIFSVQSAYNLALNIKVAQRNQATNSALDRERKLWTLVWSGEVSQK